MNEELQAYIEAIKRQVGKVQYVQVRDHDGNLTSPMPIEAAARYIYSGDMPPARTMPSEEIASQQDRKWASKEAYRQVELARARANDHNMRTFYTDVALPTLTLGLSKYIPGLEGTAYSAVEPLTASAIALQKSPVGRLIWPISALAAGWTWYANTHEPPAMRFDSIEEREDQPVVTNTEAAQRTSPAPPDNEDNNEDNDTTKNKKRSLLDLIWERSGKTSPSRFSKFKPSGATVRNYGVRLPLYTGVAAPIADLGLNAVGRAYTPDSVPYTMKFPLTRARFALERGILGLVGDAYKDSAPQDTTRTSTSQPQKGNLPEGFVPVTAIDPNTGNIIVAEDSTVSLQEPPDISRFTKK